MDKALPSDAGQNFRPIARETPRGRNRLPNSRADDPGSSDLFPDMLRNPAALMPAHRKDPALITLAGSRNPSRSRRVVRATEPLGDSPPHFTPELRQLWHELANDAPSGLLKRPDRIALEMAVALLAAMRQGTLNAAMTSHLLKLLASFGMTPAARLNLTRDDDSGVTNPFLDLMK